MAARVRIRGDVELKRKLLRLPGRVQEGAKLAVKEERHEIAENLKMRAPVLSGQLRESIRERTARRGMSGRVAITADHAEYVIYGTSKQEANDFVTPEMLIAEKRFPERARKIIRAQFRNG